MKKSILNLKGVQVLTRGEQKSVNGALGNSSCCGRYPGINCSIADLQRCYLQ